MRRRVHRRTLALTVGQRLLLGLLPSLLAVALVRGLACYGEYGRAAPEAMVLAAAALALLSLAATWANARHLGRRIARLAQVGTTTAPAGGTPDELDRIAHVVDRLGDALRACEADRARSAVETAARLREQATLLASSVRASLAQLDEVRLPLHILLETRFGVLSENQEELLDAAREATDTLDAELRRFGQIIDVDRGALVPQCERVQPNEVLRAVLPLARAAAARCGAQVAVTLAPGLPHVTADRVRLAQALVLLLESAAAASGAGRPLAVATERQAAGALVTIAPRPGAVSDDPIPDVVLALRLLDAMSAAVEWQDDALAIRLR